jgi:uncharacterized protein YbjT (DUF2867 family)
VLRRDVFITGGTGYLGRPVLTQLATRGHAVRALVRRGSEGKLPSGTPFVFGDALSAASYAELVPPADTLVQLVGTPHPSPRKAAEFERIDRPSGLAAVEAAVRAGVKHLVYVSVAHPAPMMHSYIDARLAVEARIREASERSGVAATILRPWYVLGPGHVWPHALRPFYAVARLLPATRAGAERLGLVTHAEMLRALIAAVEAPPSGVRVVDVPGIRAAALS